MVFFTSSLHNNLTYFFSGVHKTVALFLNQFRHDEHKSKDDGPVMLQTDEIHIIQVQSGQTPSIH